MEKQTNMQLNKTEKAFIRFAQKYPVVGSTLIFKDNSNDVIYTGVFNPVQNGTIVEVYKGDTVIFRKIYN